MFIMLLGTILIVPKSIFSALKSLTLIHFNYLKLKENEKDFDLLTTQLLLVGQFIDAQTKTENTILSKDKRPFYLERGINVSLPVYIQMYRSHRLAVDINTRAGKIISKKLEHGFRFDYDYRFINNDTQTLITPQSIMAERALYSNFSLFSLKPNVQFNLISKYFFGL